jgi:hypothetical protein
MNTEWMIPSCEWPDAKRPATFRNCCDKDGRVDKNLERRAAENRIEAITKQLDCPHGLTNKERRALWKERHRWKRMFNLGSYSPIVQVEDANKDKRAKAKEKELIRQAREIDRSQKE